MARVRRGRPRRRLRPSGCGADERQLDGHPAAAGSGLRGEQRYLPPSQQQRRYGGPSPDRARRPARRSGLPQGEDAQGRQRHPQRLRRRARPAAGSAVPFTRGGAQQQRTTSSDTTGWRTNSDSGSGQSTATRGGTGGVSTSGGTIRRRSLQNRSGDANRSGHARRDQRHPRRAGDRRAAAGRAVVRHRAGRAALRSHDRRGRVSRQRGPDSCRIGRARRRQLRPEGDADGSEGQPHRVVRSADRARPGLSDSRHRDAGHRERRHQGRGARRSGPAARSGRSSAASSAGSRAR